MHFVAFAQSDSIDIQLVPLLQNVAVLVVILPFASSSPHLGPDFKAKRLRDASPEALSQFLPPLLHAPPNEDDSILARMPAGPRSFQKRLVLQHVDALEDKLFVAPGDV